MNLLIGTALTLILWGIGTAIAFLLYKIGMNDHEERKSRTLLARTYDDEAANIATTLKHFKLTSMICCIGLLIAFFVSVKPIQWLCAIACGMTLPPVFYDVFYNTLPKFRDSTLNFCLFVGALINLLLMAYTLNFYYWTYINYNFV